MNANQEEEEFCILFDKTKVQHFSAFFKEVCNPCPLIYSTITIECIIDS
ncbi:hypothetical protein [Taibaiella lutea]|nr:hypothetical protein [Taibaiella lutea]